MINIVRRYQDVPQLVLILQEIYFLLQGDPSAVAVFRMRMGGWVRWGTFE